MEKEVVTVTSIFDKIRRCGTNYREGLKFASYGLNINDVLDSICTEMEDEVLPSMAELTEEEQRELLNILREQGRKEKQPIERDFLVKSVEYLKDLIVDGKHKTR